MKLFVEHDRWGRIQAVSAVEASEGLRVFPTARAGNTMSEVDVPGLSGKPGTPAFQRKVRAIMKSSVVEVGPAKLVKRDRKAGRRGRKW